MKKSPSQAQARTDPVHQWLTGRIVVGIDGSQHSSEALRRAAQIARYSGARIEAVTAWQFPAPTAPALGPVRWSARDRAHIAQQESIVTAFGSDIPESFIAFVHEGMAAPVLIELSEGADLLIVGRHGSGRSASAMLGSVSATCTERAHCPVLVIPEAGKHKPHRRT